MKGLNKVMLIGHVGRDPVLRYTPSGTPVANFSVATNEVYGNQGNRQTKTEWHTIVAWGKLAEVVSNIVKKGQLIYIEGKISTRDWTDNSGNKRTSFEIIMRDFSLLSKKEIPPQGEEEDIFSPDLPDEPISEDDVPF